MHTRQTGHFVVLLVVGSALTSSAWPCSIPVFRYALERWAPDAYRLVVFYRGELSETQRGVVQALKKLEEFGEFVPPLQMRLVEVSAEIPKELQALWKAASGSPLPWMVLLYPEYQGIDTAAWSGPLTDEHKDLVIESPARRELARRLLAGESAVWVLLRGDDAEKNRAARKVLDSTLAELKKELKLPHEYYEGEEAVYSMAMTDAVDLKIAFSVLELDRGDRAEGALVSMLTHLDPEFAKSEKPVVFPIIGRGRLLAAFAGEEINEDNIADAAMFLSGACSCQAKAQNPGIDLFIPIDWDAFIMGTIGLDEGLPPLTSPAARIELSTAAEPGASAEETSGVPSPAGGPASLGPLTRNIVILVAAAAVAVATATIVLRRRRKDA